MVSSLDFVSQNLQQRLGEDERWSVGTGAESLKIRREDHDGHAARDGESDFHAYSVIQTGAMQDSNHAVNSAQPLTVHVEQTAALAFVDEVFFIGIAERKEDCIRTCLARELLSSVCA